MNKVNRISSALIAMGVTLGSGAAWANPEAGGDYSQTTTLVTIDSSSTGSPNILRSVTVVCPVTGFLLAQADAQFGLNFTTAGSDGALGYGISRTIAIDSNHYHFLQGASASGFQYNPGSIQRFDTCTAGQSITYRFVAYLLYGLSTSTYAWQPKLSVIQLRDRY
ncbi:hypothetical protein [Methylotetracoccus oryzae]|uniref:hypothetical protein n=1 Tax=Methylotetracoccus oryzae TaxID=1919059 RepID=UPI00111A7A27|nr:hypothetical protein [Methylotetracoccus oryzae]